MKIIKLKIFELDENKNLMFFFENKLIKEHLSKLLKKTKTNIQKKTIKSIDLAENKVFTNCLQNLMI